MKQCKNTVNTSTHINKNTHTLQNPHIHPHITKHTHIHTPTHYKTHTYTHTLQNTHTHTHTHTLQNPHIHTPHITKQVKTTTVQDTHQCGICGDEVALGGDFIRVLQSSLLSSHSPLLLIYIYSSVVNAV